MTLTLAAWATLRGVSRQCAWRWAHAGRIAGAVQDGCTGRWSVPIDSPRPAPIVPRRGPDGRKRQSRAAADRRRVAGAGVGGAGRL